MSEELQFEALDTTATFEVVVADGLLLAVSVCQEQAVGDDNMMVECTIHLSEKQARELRDWLNGHFP